VSGKTKVDIAAVLAEQAAVVGPQTLEQQLTDMKVGFFLATFFGSGPGQEEATGRISDEIRRLEALIAAEAPTATTP
jgi:hypothetical protein